MKNKSALYVILLAVTTFLVQAALIWLMVNWSIVPWLDLNTLTFVQALALTVLVNLTTRGNMTSTKDSHSPNTKGFKADLN